MALDFAQEVLTSFLGAALVRRGMAGVATLSPDEQAELDSILGQLGIGLPVRMHVRGRRTILTAEVGRWVQLLSAYPRTKLFIQNRGNGATPNVGVIYFRDTEGQSGEGATEGIQILSDGHIWDEQGAHQGEVWINADTVGIRILTAEWGPEPNA